MLGVRTYSANSFGELFAPLFPSLRGLTWLTLPDAFRMPASWVDSSDFDHVNEVYRSGPIKRFQDAVSVIKKGDATYGSYSAGDLVPDFADAVSDDWSSLFGVTAPVADPLGWLVGYFEAKNRAVYLTERAHVIFISVDSSFWEFFSGDLALVERITRDFRERGIEHEPMDLDEHTRYL